MLMLTATTWGGRPSQYLGPIEPIVAHALDEALAARWIQERNHQASHQRDPDVMAAGSRYEGPDDWGVPLFDEAKARQSRETYRELIERERQVH